MTRSPNQVVPVAARSAARRGRFRAITRERVLALVLISPSLIATAVFVYGFIAWTGWVSLLNWDNPAPFRDLFPDVPFRGFETYLRLFQNDRFQIDIRNSLVFTLLFLFACLFIGFGLAVILDQKIRGKVFFQSVFLFPMAISYIATGVVWHWLLAPRAGVNLLLDATLNPLLRAIGQEPIVLGWYSDPTVLYIPPNSLFGHILASVGLGGLASEKFGVPVAMLSIVVAATWQMSGFVMLLYLVGLRAIPEELRQAARVDGASELQIYRHIVLPLLTPITLSAIVLLGDIALRMFDLVFSLSGQGPAFATDVPALFMFVTTFQGNHFSQGAAISIVMLLAVSALVIPYFVYRLRAEAKQ